MVATRPATQACRGVNPSPGVLLFAPGHAHGLPVLFFAERELSRHAWVTFSDSPRAAASQIVGVAERISSALARGTANNSRISGESKAFYIASCIVGVNWVLSWCASAHNGGSPVE